MEVERRFFYEKDQSDSQTDPGERHRAVVKAAEARQKAKRKGNRKLLDKEKLALNIVDGILLLVSAGFNEQQVVFEWPYDKFTMFVKAAERQKLKDRVDFTVDIAQTMVGVLGGKGTSVKEHVDNLTESIERINVS